VEKLYRGIHKFQKSYFKKEEEFFRRLSGKQDPDVLFITCADSRVDPTLVTQSRPGDLFIVRNVGNIIPPYDAIRDKNSVAAALEFAVLVLKVADIIVCGHSNCGAMKVLFQDEKGFLNMPHLREWVDLSKAVRNHVEQHYTDASPDLKERIMEKENVLEQLKNVETYPFISQALEQGEVYLHGWYYDIGTGEVLSYNPVTDSFEKIP
jgi:carbonic anhydrase